MDARLALTRALVRAADRFATRRGRIAGAADGGGRAAPTPAVGDGFPFQEAIDFHRNRDPLTKEAWRAKDDEARRRAFTLANVAQLDAIVFTQDALTRALEDGSTFRDFQEEVRERLERAFGGTVADPGARLETIFRNAAQTAYNAGRYEQAIDPDVITERPYWRFDGIADERQTDVCKKCNDVIRRADDPWWRTHLPPLHHRCRSGFTTLTEEQARAAGVTLDAKLPEAQPAEGFGRTPADRDTVVAELLAEKLGQAPERLQAIAVEKLSQPRPAPGSDDDEAARVTPRPVRPVPIEQLSPAHAGTVGKLTKYGVNVVVEDYNNADVVRHLDDLALLPDDLADRLAMVGLRKVHVAARRVPEFPGQEALAGRAAPGPAGRRWDDVAACWEPGQRAILLGAGRSSSVSPALHEAGHAVWELFGFLHDSEWAFEVSRLIRAGRVPAGWVADYTSPSGDQTELAHEVLAEAVAIMLSGEDGYGDVERLFDPPFARFVADRLFPAEVDET